MSPVAVTNLSFCSDSGAIVRSSDSSSLKIYSTVEIGQFSQFAMKFKKKNSFLKIEINFFGWGLFFRVGRERETNKILI